METTLVILKPDAVERGLMGEIIRRIENKGLKIVGARFMRITPDLASRHYAVHQGKPFYPGLVKFMTTGPVMVLAVQGNQAINVVRTMMGPTKGYEAAPGTIRGDYGSSRSFNLIHGSDGPESAATELSLFFKPEELVEYQRSLDGWIVDLSSGKAE
jgi:nucleoside-diphosphate kinase